MSPKFQLMLTSRSKDGSPTKGGEASLTCAVDQPAYEPVATTSEIALGKCLRVEVGSCEILICHTAEGFFAVDNTCSHSHAQLHLGRLRGHKIFCPLHGTSFDVRDDNVLSRPAIRPLVSHPLRVEGEEILVATGSHTPTRVVP
jgi:3-phenylpropionate/trans-cinnamate dioxygenase ferredoxin subunit